MLVLTQNIVVENINGIYHIRPNRRCEDNIKMVPKKEDVAMLIGFI